jgi:hypothetical protein
MVLFKQIVTLICTPCIEEKKKKFLSPQETTGEKRVPHLPETIEPRILQSGEKE